MYKTVSEILSVNVFLVISSDTFSSVFKKVTFKVHSLKEEETECLLCSCVVYNYEFTESGQQPYDMDFITSIL